MKYKLIEEKSVGEFNATLEMRANYPKDIQNDWGANKSKYRPLATRTWEVYGTDSKTLLFTIILEENVSYKSNKLNTKLVIKLPSQSEEDAQENQIASLKKFSKIISDIYCVSNYCSTHDATKFSITIDLTPTKYEYIKKLYEFLQYNNYFALPIGLITEIDAISYKRILTEAEVTIYNEINNHIKNKQYGAAICYVNGIIQEMDIEDYDSDNCDYHYYLGNILHEKEYIQEAFNAFNIPCENNFYSACLKNRIKCAQDMIYKDGIDGVTLRKWRSIYLSNYITYFLSNELMSKEEMLNEVSRHFSNFNIAQTILQNIRRGKPLLKEIDTLVDLLCAFAHIIEEQNATILELSRANYNSTPGYDRHVAAIDAEEKLTKERNDSPSKRREFDKKFGLNFIG